MFFLLNGCAVDLLLLVPSIDLRVPFRLDSTCSSSDLEVIGSTDVCLASLASVWCLSTIAGAAAAHRLHRR